MSKSKKGQPKPDAFRVRNNDALLGQRQSKAGAHTPKTQKRQADKLRRELREWY